MVVVIALFAVVVVVVGVGCCDGLLVAKMWLLS